MEKVVILVLCSVLVWAQMAQCADDKAKTTEGKKKFFTDYAEECRADLNECLDHSWAHLPDSPPVGYCCEHYNYCLYGP
ncbi:hypothetical protein JTE90_009112 [Oedothorax gibbosus]|uniref:Uncharacterized protein n=1 Tax=Oedothorax gibbosus TaxID=931172 RepID=A0AAV6UGA9_9ARAC|nr:hypothetical protein JTE90_009112 [Oedothorax gibbosus]